MYESEANPLVESVDQLPARVVEQFREFRENVTERTLLPWGEHCTECVWPTCYTTCDLYSPREDGRCRRFVDGMVRLDCTGSTPQYLLKIRFKRWGKLWAPGNLHLVPVQEADRAERRDQRIGATLYQLPTPIRNFATGKRYGWKKRMAVGAKAPGEGPDLFVVECYNPGKGAISLTLTMRSSSGQTNAIPYQKLITVQAGFHRESIAVEEISRSFDLHSAFSVDLTPNDIQDDTALFFGLVDFVRVKAKPANKSAQQSPLKCVVWDLDNTLWTGTLVEDGAQNLELKAGIVEVIQELDRRGILQSVASKNNFDEALAVVKNFGLDEYFLHPQISWSPKSEAMKTIARKLNIGIDTLMFIDDSEFELAEVRSECPTVRLLKADQYRDLPEMPVCQLPVTEESRNRRQMYRQEAVRESSAESFGGDYLTFLRECKLEMQIEPLSDSNLERVHELTQRTNQMNFSGNRYDRSLLAKIAVTPHLDTYVLSCKDRFGSYGIVGFSIVDSNEPRMTDLMFSCRIQAKRVEHAFLTHLLKKYVLGAGTDFWANYRKTPRNAPSGQVFEDMGLEVRSEQDGVSSLIFPRDRAIPDDGVIQILETVPVMQISSDAHSSAAR